MLYDPLSTSHDSWTNAPSLTLVCVHFSLHCPFNECLSHHSAIVWWRAVFHNTAAIIIIIIIIITIIIIIIGTLITFSGLLVYTCPPPSSPCSGDIYIYFTGYNK